MKRCLILELWGIGDATLMTSALQGLLADGWTITILAKPSTCAFITASYPGVNGIALDAPWTVFQGKYKLWRWPWPKLIQVLRQLRRERFDAALSIRKDPRDHFLMWLASIRRRIGFSTPLGKWFLNEPLPIRNPDAHRVEDWWQLQRHLSGSTQACLPPRLTTDTALATEFRSRLGADSRPVIVLHTGARITVRRWPEAYFREIIMRLRKEFDFQLVLIPDPDGYGRGLADLADHTLDRLSLPGLLAVLSCATQVICNDSGPSHLADALGIPVIAIFGPQRPEWFRPFRPDNLVIIRDICPLRPCNDYCRFPEPYCLTKLTPEMAWPEIRDYLNGRDQFPPA
jgi:heptosyltransferase-2